MADRVECVVIGAGVVGLAVARALARRGRETLVLEAEDGIGTGTSSRSSEVIHAGLYYPPGSAKSRLCVAGKRQLYEYCEGRGIEHRRCGKLVVATHPGQTAVLEKIEVTARANGVLDLRWLTAVEAARMEPSLRCAAALLSPSTGIIDSHGLMLALRADLEEAGGTIALRSPVRRGHGDIKSIHLVAGSDETVELAAKIVVNSAGLGAQALARQLEGLAPESIPPLAYAKGSYYVLQGRAPFQRLIYPVPEPGGLGVHLTIDLAGRARFGPDVEWVDRVDYSVDPARAEHFYREIRRYWPDLPQGSLQPGYAGIRPKLGGPEAPAADFMIQGSETHGIPGLVNLYGIESPGLTAALAIAEEVARAVDQIP